MKEYIERTAALDVVKRTSGDYAAAWSEIAHMPAADVAEVRHGRWICKGMDGSPSWKIDGRGPCWRVYDCSECQCRTSAKTKYCPNCGALMKEDEHETG